LEVGVTRLEGVVEPTTEVVVAGSRVGLAEEGGDLGGNLGVMEKRESRIRVKARARVGGGDEK
jgi:hypothetical protein